ncbi:MAG: lipopolysaccharide heptosyltransferase family protein [Alphaproteobacteria bacterium]|nr:lipopolysaccharide heptosyltransferase family protein [Alphaproteobacteria bacterium]
MTLQQKQRLDLHLGRLLIVFLKPFVMLAGLLLRRDHDLVPRRRIVAIKLMGGGSLVLAFPALLGLRRRYPDIRMTLVCTPATKSFADLLQVFDDLVVVEDGGIRRLVASACRALRACWGADTVIDFEVHSRLTTVFAACTAARNRLGFYLETAFWRRGLATHLFFFNRSAPSWRFYDQIAVSLGAVPADTTQCRAWLAERSALTQPVPSSAPVRRLALACFCSDLSAERMLTAEQWAGLIAAGLPAVEEVTLFGGPGDREKAEAFAAVLAAGLPRARIVNACGIHSLDASIRSLLACDQFWSIDTGLLHVARMIGLSSVSYWGPTDPATLLRPIEGLVERQHYARISCSPCVHLTEIPPCQGRNLCMRIHTEPGAVDVNPIWLQRG